MLLLRIVFGFFLREAGQLWFDCIVITVCVGWMALMANIRKKNHSQIQQWLTISMCYIYEVYLLN